MFHTTTHHPASASEGLHAYGLAGIELGHRAGARQVSGAREVQLRKAEVRGPIGNLRQMLGDVMVRAGTGLAGAAARPAPGAAMP